MGKHRKFHYSYMLMLIMNNDIIVNSYTLVNKQKYGKSPFLIGKSSVNGPFSIAI